MFYLRAAVSLLGFLIAGLYGFTIAVVRRDKTRVASDYSKLLGRLMLPPLGIRMRISGTENLHREWPVIYVANHQSYLDVPILGQLYPPKTVVIAKEEIRDVPFFGRIYTATGSMVIDRSKSAAAVQRLKKVGEEVRRRGVSVWIMPEGTRGKMPGELLPFKKGAFQLAITLGVPLVPVVTGPLKPIIDLGARRIRPGIVELQVLEPIPTEGLTERDLRELMARTWRQMSTVLAGMAARQGLPPSTTAAPSEVASG